MADRRTSHDALIALLDDVRPLVEFPDARGVAAVVRERIAETTDADRLQRGPGARRVRVLVAAILVVVLVASTVAAVPASRNAVADWLGLRGVRIEQSGGSSDAVFDAVGTELRLGRPTTLDEAERLAGFPVTVPSLMFAAPDLVFLGSRPPGGRVSFLYAPSALLPPAGRDDVGLLITQFSASMDEGVLGKRLAVDSTIDAVAVGDRNGYWISGGRHVVGLTDRDGNLFRDTTRLAANTLLVQDGARTIRIESALPKEEAIRIGQSLLRTESSDVPGP